MEVHVNKKKSACTSVLMKGVTRACISIVFQCPISPVLMGLCLLLLIQISDTNIVSDYGVNKQLHLTFRPNNKKKSFSPLETAYVGFMKQHSSTTKYTHTHTPLSS